MFYTADQLLNFQADINAEVDYKKVAELTENLLKDMEEVVKRYPSVAQISVDMIKYRNSHIWINILSEKEIMTIVNKLEEELGFSVELVRNKSGYRECYSLAMDPITTFIISWGN